MIINEKLKYQVFESLFIKCRNNFTTRTTTMIPPSILNHEEYLLFAHTDENTQKKIFDLANVYDIWYGAYLESKEYATNCLKGSPEWELNRTRVKKCVIEMCKTSKQITNILFNSLT